MWFLFSGFSLQPRPPSLAEEELAHPTSWVHEYIYMPCTMARYYIVL